MLAAVLLVASICGAQGGPQPAATAQDPKAAKAAQAEKNHRADIQGDVEMGDKYVVEVEKQEKLSTDKAMIDRVQRIGAEIAVIANSAPVNCSWGDKRLNQFKYTYRVLKGDDVNAFSLPGGHVYVYEGLLRDVESDDELAGVLGHETAHAAFRHVATLQKEESKMMNISLPLILLSLFLGRGSSANAVIPATQLFQQAVGSGWSVKAEQAADYGGYQYLKKTHYDPTGMLTFMERLAERETTGMQMDWGIYRTHPPGPERAESLLAHMREDHIPIRRSKVTRSFQVTVHPSDKGLVEIDFGNHPLVAFSGSDALTRADGEVGVLNDFFDSTPELFDVHGGNSGQIIGGSHTVMTLTDEDAKAAGMSVDELKDKVIKNLRLCLFNLGYRVWSAHG